MLFNATPLLVVLYVVFCLECFVPNLRNHSSNFLNPSADLAVSDSKPRRVSALPIPDLSQPFRDRGPSHILNDLKSRLCAVIKETSILSCLEKFGKKYPSPVMFFLNYNDEWKDFAVQ